MTITATTTNAPQSTGPTRENTRRPEFELVAHFHSVDAGQPSALFVGVYDDDTLWLCDSDNREQATGEPRQVTLAESVMWMLELSRTQSLEPQGEGFVPWLSNIHTALMARAVEPSINTKN